MCTQDKPETQRPNGKTDILFEESKNYDSNKATKLSNDEYNFNTAINKLLALPPDKENISLIQGYLSVERIKNDNASREKFATWVKIYLISYTIFVGLFLLAAYIGIPKYSSSQCGWCIDFIHINVPDSVIIALLTTTTANIIGMVIIVLKGLFNPTDFKID